MLAVLAIPGWMGRRKSRPLVWERWRGLGRGEPFVLLILSKDVFKRDPVRHRLDPFGVNRLQLVEEIEDRGERFAHRFDLAVAEV